MSAGIIVALREGIAVHHVSLKGDPSRPDGDLVAVPALAHLVELDSDKRPHELDCQSQSGVKIGAPSGPARHCFNASRIISKLSLALAPLVLVVMNIVYALCLSAWRAVGQA